MAQQLTDSIASQIMGEIDVVTRNIDNLQGRIEFQLKHQEFIGFQIDDTKKQFACALTNLITEAEALKATQVTLIQDQLAVSMVQIEAKTNAQIKVFAAASKEMSIEEINAIADSTHHASQVAVEGALKGIERKFEEALDSIADANKSFANIKDMFIKDVKQCVEGAEKAVKKYDLALQISASQHRPISTWEFVLLAVLASTISAGGLVLYMSQRAAGKDAGQAALAAHGAKFKEIYPQLDAKTQEKIIKLWK
ncbi:hypothetical protein [Polaromonas hydrogenivorans]|uniref:Uncharacterized protein n=1 Tax=Polaromonas hydrogenivorans TaxID=335476 RepID=A0AAU7LZY7_9BURK